jgi:hypothetical protein
MGGGERARGQRGVITTHPREARREQKKESERGTTWLFLLSRFIPLQGGLFSVIVCVVLKTCVLLLSSLLLWARPVPPLPAAFAITPTRAFFRCLFCLTDPTPSSLFFRPLPPPPSPPPPAVRFRDSPPPPPACRHAFVIHIIIARPKSVVVVVSVLLFPCFLRSVRRLFYGFRVFWWVVGGGEGGGTEKITVRSIVPSLSLSLFHVLSFPPLPPRVGQSCVSRAIPPFFVSQLRCVSYI